MKFMLRLPNTSRIGGAMISPAPQPMRVIILTSLLAKREKRWSLWKQNPINRLFGNV